MTNRRKFWPWAALCLALMAQGCKKNLPAEPCDQGVSTLHEGKYFIASEFLTEERGWDYNYWARFFQGVAHYRPAEACIPLYRDPDLAERIEQIEKNIDLKR